MSTCGTLRGRVDDAAVLRRSDLQRHCTRAVDGRKSGETLRVGRPACRCGSHRWGQTGALRGEARQRGPSTSTSIGRGIDLLAVRGRRPAAQPRTLPDDSTRPHTRASVSDCAGRRKGAARPCGMGLRPTLPPAGAVGGELVMGKWSGVVGYSPAILPSIELPALGTPRPCPASTQQRRLTL